MNLLNAELVFYFVMFKVQICTGLSADPLVSGSALWIPQPLCSDLIRICDTENMTTLLTHPSLAWAGWVWSNTCNNVEPAVTAVTFIDSAAISGLQHWQLG